VVVAAVLVEVLLSLPVVEDLLSLPVVEARGVGLLVALVRYPEHPQH
jgi:hypothetical protein